MKKISTILLLFLVINALSQTPTITTNSPVQTSFCAGGNILVQYETTGVFDFGNFFTAQLSDMWGNFSNPVNIGTVPINTGLIPGTIPNNTSFGFNYRVRVVSSNPYIEGSISPMPPLVITNSVVSAYIVASPASAVCHGDTVELYANFNETYQWSTGDTTQSILVTQTGNYNVTVTNYITGCEVTSDDFFVEVYPLPILNLGADTGICDGDVLVLDAGPGNVHYKWNNGLSDAQDFYVHTTGTYFVEVKDSNDCENSDTIMVTVNPNPVVDLGNDTSFCGNVFFIDAGSGFISYNWNYGLSYNQVLQVNHPGTYFVTVIDTNNCKASDTIFANVMNIPYLSLGNDVSICGNSIMLDAGSGFVTYNWNEGAGNSQYFTVTQTGTYYVLIADSNDCKVSDTVNITINHLPFIFLGNDIITDDNQILFLDAGSGFNAYLWNDGSDTQTLEVNTALTGEGNFTYWVTVFNDFCFNTDTILIIVDNDYSINKYGSKDVVKIYPIPFKDKFTIEFVCNDLMLFRNPTVKFYDLLGKEILFDIVQGENSLEINGTAHNKGVYIYRIYESDRILCSGRVVKY